MAVNCYEASCENKSPKSSCSSNSSKGGSLQPCRLVKINFAADDGITGSLNKQTKSKKSKDTKSPYLAGEKVQLLTRITEKRLIQKKGNGMISSFPLAVNLYKASSDEFKTLKKMNKKVKKSVLTLPNEPAPVPQACTVSDMNDSEYFERNYETRAKKRLPVANIKKCRGRQHKDFEFYDRDARYCSEMNIDLDCSSTDLLKPYEGGKRIAKNKTLTCKDRAGDEVNAHDVWAVLRNINRFQFHPSPPMSDDSIRSHKKKKPIPKKRFKRRDARIIETCRTEEFAYISRFDLDSKSPSFSQSSSFDRVTVIDQQNELSKMCKQFEKNFTKSRNLVKDNVKPAKQIKNATHNKTSPKANEKKAIKMKEHNNNKVMHSEPNVLALKMANAEVEKHGDAIVKHEGQYKKSSTSSFDMHCMEPRFECVQKISSVRVNDGRKRTGKKSPSPKSPVQHYEDMCDNFVYSGNSGTSKEGNGDIKLCSEDRGKTQSAEELDHVMISDKCNKGISKELAVLQKKRVEPVLRKSRLITKPVILPLTQTDIKRRLASLKFPIVVLGREQVSSKVPVITGETPQFDGLDKHIWPFMIDWEPRCKKGDNNKIDSRGIFANIQKKKLSSPTIESEKQRKYHSELVSPNRQISLQNRKQICSTDTSKKKKVEQKRPMQIEDSDNKAEHGKKPKSIRTYKDRVIKMLYKKSSSQSFVMEHYQDSEQGDIKTIIAPNGGRRKVDACTETSLLCNTFSRDILSPLLYNNNNKSLNKALAIKYPWSKGKLASDFIETVIKKIMHGVYYTHDHKRHEDSREASIQTTVSFKSNLSNNVSPQLEILRTPVSSDPLIALPGFENTMPDLEIKTLNPNQISVKHCVTNIMLQFDVKLPPEPVNAKIHIKSSSSLIPLEVIDSQTRIFKCKTSILNAMLPAELCSLLPKMLHSIMDTEIKLALPPLNKTESHLSTITEITLCENMDVLPPFLVSNEMQNLLKGVFSNATTKRPLQARYINPRSTFSSNWSRVVDLLPKLPRRFLFYYETNIAPLVFCAKKNTKRSVTCLEMLSPSSNAVACTALVPYTGTIQIPQPDSKQMDLPEINNVINTDFNINSTYNIPLFIKPLQITCDNNNVKVNMAIINSRGLNTEMSITIKDLKIDSLYNWFPRSAFENNFKAITGCGNCSEKCVSDVSNYCSTENKNNLKKKKPSIGKMRRRGFAKLYRKCKSTTSIVSEKPTPLSKIMNLDDFLQVIGTSKQLFSVFDDCMAKKILSSIIEMKAWITEISARQALLALLLLNKKDTPNLTRFRPVLLQGIAVNRITRSHELDMEIEVIERENIRFSQYEGISYLAASRENQDSLLEELYWIAKTTASDYQRPFDETSEKLLKSLLEKRKMLNPSYLRVMARYVGLGLLKSPKKN